MDLRELQYLLALAEEKSISQAAERLFMAQSSLSQFLSNTESQLGYNCSSGPPAASVPPNRENG